MGNEENSEVEVLPTDNSEVELVQEQSLQCCIGDCDSKHEPSIIGVLSFHKVPTEPYGIRQSWINVIRQSRQEPEWTPDDNSAVCSRHFRTDDLVKIPGTRRVVLDLESCPNLVPSLKLGTKFHSAIELDASGDDEVNVVAADPGFSFTPLKIKEEPRSEEEDNLTNENSQDYPEDDPEITPSTRPKKVKRTPKPTWSLKELSDDEGARDGYVGESSDDYEPTSSSDSDSDKEKSSSSTSKKARLISGHSGLMTFNNGMLVRNNASSSSGNGRGPNFSNLSRKISQHGLNHSRKTTPVSEKFVPHLLSMIRWVEEMSNVNRSAPSENLYYNVCMSRLEKILHALNNFPSSEFTSQLEKHLQGLVGVVKQRHSEGQSMANKVHFSLVSKKVLQILRDKIEKGVNSGSSSPQASSTKGGSRNIVPRRIIPDLQPASIPPRTSNFVLNSSNGMLSKNGPIPTHHKSGLVITPTRLPANKPSTSVEPTVVTLDDDEDEDDFTPTIQSVQTLANSNSLAAQTPQRQPPSAIARSFSLFLRSIQSAEIPPPLPDEQAELVPWMGLRMEDTIDEDSSGVVTSQIFATSPTYPRGHFPPNSVVTLNKPGPVQPHVRTPITSRLLTQNGTPPHPNIQALAHKIVNSSQNRQVFSGFLSGDNGFKAAPAHLRSNLSAAAVSHVSVEKLSAVTVPKIATVPSPSVQSKRSIRSVTPRNSKPVEEVILLSDSDEEITPKIVQSKSLKPISNDDSILGI